ncbi:MAG TPA: hypothetical protein VE962_00810 [Actinomycetota bacterium]|nr:hypothetical protein [Actinomycetota bacterium]
MRWVVLVAVCLLPACASEPEVPPSVTGLITSIDRSDRGGITGFTVEAEGERYDIRIDPGRDYGFDLEHLEEHRAQSDPVRVTIEERDGQAYAFEILDA